jgi:hypothetical protein
MGLGGMCMRRGRWVCVFRGFHFGFRFRFRFADFSYSFNLCVDVVSFCGFGDSGIGNSRASGLCLGGKGRGSVVLGMEGERKG